MTTINIDKFTVRIVRNGEKYGLDFCLTYDSQVNDPLVEFYDARYPHTEYGQFVSRYYASTLSERDTGGLCLDGGVPEWSVTEADMHLVRKWVSLHIALTQAIKDCERYSRPAHAVRNCPSDLQDEDAAWRRRKSIEFQIREIKSLILNQNGASKMKPDLTQKHLDVCNTLAKIEDAYSDHHNEHGRIDKDSRANFVADLLADIRHYCDVHGLDYFWCDISAQGYYAEEVSPSTED